MMNEINAESKQPVESNAETDAAAEVESVRKLITPDVTEESDPDDPRRPGRVDRTKLKTEDVATSDEE